MSAVPGEGPLVKHPAPQRRRTHPLLLLVVLTGAPAAWMTQLLFAFAVTSYVCFRPAGVPIWVQPAIITLNLAALAAGAVTLAIAMQLLRLTRSEHEEAARDVVDAGEGRTRFLSVWGIIISSVFVVATLANSFSLFLVPLCRI